MATLSGGIALVKTREALLFISSSASGWRQPCAEAMTIASEGPAVSPRTDKTISIARPAIHFTGFMVDVVPVD